MSRQAKTVIGLVIVAVVALVAMLMMGPLVGIVIAVAGGLGVVVVLQRMDDAPALPSRPRSKKRDTTTDLLESATSHVEPLSTWTPPDSLTPWTPPVDETAASFTDLAPPPDAPAAPSDDDFWSGDSTTTGFADLAEPSIDDTPSWLADPAPVDDAPAETTSWLADPAPAEPSIDDTPSWLASPAPADIDEPSGVPEPDLAEAGLPEWSSTDPWADGSTWDGASVATDTNPLDEIARLDEVDVIAELERLDEQEAKPSTSLFDVGHVAPINEDVASADDIMAASQATELQVESEDNSELAKLLAKVQARLAAYE